MRAEIVVGLGFGDEGKGITTDFLVSQHSGPSIVVRYCGGQQAGHNVVIGEKSHIHASYGSGTLRGKESYISEDCCIYPPNMFREREVLREKGVEPRIYFHPMVKVTTHYDVAFNRMVEKTNYHGSCGIGVGATMARNTTPHKMHAVDLTNNTAMMAKLAVVNKYYESMMWEYNAKQIKIYRDEVKTEEPFFYEAVSKLPWSMQPYLFLRSFSHVVFEGAQGILLDKDCGISFPNLTYGNATSKNAIEIARHIQAEDVAMYYVTRTYLTRHGNGYIPGDPIKLINNEKETNTQNEWQGIFRVRELDYDLLNYAITTDIAFSERVKRNLVVTCCDQRPDFHFNVHKLHYMFKETYFSWSADSKDFKGG